MHRFLLGKAPGNALETKAFARLAGISALTRSTLGCALERLDDLPVAQRVALFDSTLGLDAASRSANRD